MTDSPTTSLAVLSASLSVVSGELDAGKFTAYGIFRNEIYFAAAFLTHHRALGVEQFLILDDGSDDGTREFLSSQPDCVVLASTFRFGQRVRATDLTMGRSVRAGILLKTAIPRRFLLNQWSLYLDADEFLFLPPQTPSIRDLATYLDSRGIRAVVASMVDFYPLDLAVGGSRAPVDLQDLLDEAGYFDADPVIDLRESSERRRPRVSDGASVRLFRTYGIGKMPLWLRLLPYSVRRKLGWRPPGAQVKKVPLVRWDQEVRMLNSHGSTVKAADDIMLTLAHFKFVSDLSRRARSAVAWRSYAGQSRKYDYYLDLLDRVARVDGTLLGPTSRRFESVEDFIAARLMIVPPDLG